jgi:iron transport multicopper oxidase
MHLHGHQFQVIERSDPKAGKFSGTYSKLPATPIRRDTIMVQNEGYAVVRFRADNPGWCNKIERNVQNTDRPRYLALPLPH